MTQNARRPTRQRAAVEAVLADTDDFLSAQDLHARLRTQGQSVGLATVYRTLKEFVDAGLLNCFQLDGRTVYEHDYGYPQHDHLYCTQCRKLIEFQSDALAELIGRVGAEHGFRVNDHRLIVNGICAECVKLRRRIKRKQDLV